MATKKKAKKKVGNFIEANVIVYKTTSNVTIKELNEFNDAFTELVEKHGMYYSGTIGLKKVRN